MLEHNDRLPKRGLPSPYFASNHRDGTSDAAGKSNGLPAGNNPAAADSPPHSHAPNDPFHWSLTQGTPVGRALISAAQRLSDSGSDSARLDSQVLLAHVLKQNRSWLFAHHEHELSDRDCRRYADLITRRRRREPVAYLLGRKEFYGLEFAVDRRVLIPRPETELLIDLVLAQIGDRTGRPVVVADVGTGSGAIAITVAVHAPEVKVYGTDVSRDALDVAEENKRRLTPDGGPLFLEGDLLSPLPEPADIIVANLPYIADEEYSGLQSDVRDYEPRLALKAGAEGLDLIERLLQQLSSKVQSGGAVLLEISPRQGEVVQEMAQQLRPKPSYVGLRRDYSGLVRMVTLEF
ncbi:MAG: peptide chain release factor N(5)-glutamine methyltransferase [Caldilineaceae bacterium]|nr:peptide chain release factor N(5)-glutamine methyltransferase [Caldilineaceae bacterium]